MKKFILIFILVSINSGLFADAGNAYRCKATLKLTDNSEITGYFFFITSERKYDKNKTDFKKYIEDYYHFPIRLFENIKTVEINEYITVDFAVIGSERTINKNEIISIELISEIETKVGSRLREVTEKQFELINQDYIYSERIYNETYAENCSFYLLSWSKRNSLDEVKKEIADRIEKLLIGNNYQGIFEYIENKKLELAENGILLFDYCSAL